MRFRQANRCGSARWWRISLCALLLASTYVVFDILDVDGSQMSRVPAPDGTLVAMPEVDGERFFRTTLAVASSTDLLPLPLPRLSACAPNRNSAAEALLRRRWGHLPRRVTLASARARGNAPTGDPL